MKLQNKAAGLPWSGCSHVKDHDFDKKCKCEQVTIWSTPVDTIIVDKYRNTDGSGPEPLTRKCELNTMSFILELANSFPQIAESYEQLHESLKDLTAVLDTMEEIPVHNDVFNKAYSKAKQLISQSTSASL